LFFLSFYRFDYYVIWKKNPNFQWSMNVSMIHLPKKMENLKSKEVNWWQLVKWNAQKDVERVTAGFLSHIRSLIHSLTHSLTHSLINILNHFLHRYQPSFIVCSNMSIYIWYLSISMYIYMFILWEKILFLYFINEIQFKKQIKTMIEIKSLMLITLILIDTKYTVQYVNQKQWKSTIVSCVQEQMNPIHGNVSFNMLKVDMYIYISHCPFQPFLLLILSFSFLQLKHTHTLSLSHSLIYSNSFIFTHSLTHSYSLTNIIWFYFILCHFISIQYTKCMNVCL
jgi:hypothetical protein